MAVALEESVGDEEVPPADAIAQLMRQRISHYLASRSDPSLYQSVRNMSQFVSDDYGNRFLVELIQNAHDAHDPSRTDGEIAIVLDASEGEHGCLYVANRGVGFIGSNLKAITNIALSSKPVNAGIGNKGLGFRSVLQICNWPEIYSIRGAGGSGVFDGYCFRFATVDDLRAQLDDDVSEEIAQEMAHNLPCWHVPIPAEPGANVARFSKEGFATVVRLPLKSADALVAVRAQIDVLLGLKTPLHLFLERVERISLDRGTAQPFFLERSVTQTWTVQPPGFKVDAPVEVAKVRLGDAEFVIGHWDVDDKLFREALLSSLEKNEVPESWRGWEGAARVSVAVPLGAPLVQGRLYCFLPLGEEGKAPFAGYINANFYTKMDRRKVDASIRLNDLFMRVAVWLSCQLIGFLVKSDWRQAGSAVVSLLCWDDAYVEALKHAMGDNGQGIINREFLPVRGPGGTINWASPKETYAWIAPPDACLSPTSVCEIGGGRVLTESLTLNQRIELDRLYLRLRHADFKPPAGVVADWVERVAGQLHEDGAAPERWAAFYDEVSVAMAGHASALFGKRFLLSVSGDLISSEVPTSSGSTGRSKRAADVYFAPVLSVDADVDDDASKQSLPLERLPATLRKGFALLNREVPWLKDDGGHRPGRSFLIAGKLAREYDTRDVLRTLAGVTRTSGADRTREQALEWAFRLWNSGRSLSDKETRSAGFFVPTAEGWIDAQAAMFGAGWDVPNGRRLHVLLRVTADASEDLRRSLTRLLPEHAAWPIRHGTQADWVRFLAAAGVTDCLRPIGGESVTFEPTGNPANLPAFILRGATGLAEALRAHWRAQLTQDCTRMYTSRQYRAELRPWRIPGQSEHESFPAEVRRDYAVQVALAMRALGDEHRSFRAVRADTGAVATEPHRLSTPLHAFLTGAEWLPVTRPGGQLRFVKPSAAWYFNTDEERPPRFVDFVVHQVAAAIDATTLEWLQDRAQLGLFNDERHAGRAVVALSEAASSRISDIRDVRRFQELFRRLWASARQDGMPKAGSCVPVLVGGEIGVVTRTGDALAVAYFDDERDGLKKQLLEEVGEPVFDLVRGDTTAAWNWANASTPGRFRRISDEPAEVYVDGIKFDDGTPSRLLSDIVGPWIIDFLVCVAEHKSSAFVQSTQNTLGRIRRAAMALAVISGEQIHIAHGDERVPLPPSLRGALALHRPVGPVLIIQTAERPFTLDHLAGAAGQLAAALGSRELAHGLDAALLRLAAAMRDHDGEAPEDSIVATALGVEPEAIRQTRRLASGDLIGMLDLAIPLSACIGPPDVTSRLQELATQDDPHDDDLRAALEGLATSLGLPLTELEERMMHLVDLPDLKTEFSLPIAQLNKVIAGLGGRYKTVSNEHIHRDVWARHLRQRLPATIERLRERATGKFDRREPLNAYAAARDGALAISPDPAWFTAYDELPEAVMDLHINEWIDGRLPAEAAEVPLDLTLNESRTSNGARLRDFWIKFSPVLSAWVRAPGTATKAEVRQAWSNAETSRDACIARARDSGWLDFRALEVDEIAKWLTLDGVWPDGHAASVDLVAWGLTADSMASSEERAKAERAEQQRRRMEVEFAGVTMSALSDRYADIAAAVAATAAQAPALDHVSPNDATLEPMDLAKASGGSGGGGSRGAPKLPESGMSDEQKLAVGLIGELWAREWLRRRHHLESIDESHWVSCYRDAVLNTSGGSDSWGYDFIVATKSRTYYYEIKASTGDPLRFEMGPTEIFAAQRYRADREHRYRVLYLAHVGDPARMTVTLLANPFSAKAAGKFRPVGKGSVVYEFDPAT